MRAKYSNTKQTLHEQKGYRGSEEPKKHLETKSTEINVDSRIISEERWSNRWREEVCGHAPKDISQVAELQNILN